MDDITNALAEILHLIDWEVPYSDKALAEEVISQLQYKGLKIVPVEESETEGDR